MALYCNISLSVCAKFLITCCMLLQVDDDTVVFVADPGLGNILNFNVGTNVDL